MPEFKTKRLKGSNLAESYTLNNQTVMIQIRKNIVDRILDDIEKSRASADDFVRFLALEPVDLNWDIYERLTRTAAFHLGFGRQQDIRIDTSHPDLRRRPGQGVLSYLKDRLLFRLERFIIHVMTKRIRFDQRVATSVIYQKTIEEISKGNSI